MLVLYKKCVEFAFNYLSCCFLFICHVMIINSMFLLYVRVFSSIVKNDLLKFFSQWKPDISLETMKSSRLFFNWICVGFHWEIDINCLFVIMKSYLKVNFKQGNNNNNNNNSNNDKHHPRKHASDATHSSTYGTIVRHLR